jgi:acetyl esterase
MRKDIEFAKPGGVSLTLDAWVPDGKGPFPTVIIVHGGGFARGDKTTYVPPLFEPLTQAGFTWFTINYRLYPQVKSEAMIEDVEAAISYVKTHAKEYKVDLSRVVLMGESAGGYLVSFVGVRNKSAIKFAAVVPFYAPHDWEERAKEESEGKIGPSVWREVFSVPAGNSPEAVKRMREVSAVTLIKKGLPPFLLIHGTADAQVNYQQSVNMQKKMQAAGNVCDLITVDGGPHGMGVITKYPETAPKMIAWMKKTLKVSQMAMK